MESTLESQVFYFGSAGKPPAVYDDSDMNG